MLAQTRTCDASHLHQVSRRRVWTRQRTVAAPGASCVQEQPMGWFQPSRSMELHCVDGSGDRASSSSSTQLSRDAKTLVASVAKGEREAHEWLQAASNLPSQDVLKAAYSLHRLAAKMGSEPAGQGVQGPGIQQLMARQFLLVLENRDLHDLQGDITTLSTLCRMLLDLNQFQMRRAQGPLQQAEAVASARLTWRHLLAWVCNQVVLRADVLDTRVCAVILQCLASAAYPAQHEVLLVLVQGLLSLPSASPHSSASDQDAPSTRPMRLYAPSSQSATAVTASLNALASLRPLLKEHDTSQVQACLEQCALQLAPHLNSMCPRAVLALCQACHQYSCMLPPETVTAVLHAAQNPPAAGAPRAAAWLATSAALVSPFAACAASLHHQLIQSVLGDASRDESIAAAYLQGLHAVSSSTAGAQHQGLAEAVITSGRPKLMAHALWALAGSTGAGDSCKALLQALTPHLDQLPTSSLCQASSAVGTLRLHSTPPGQALMQACSQRLTDMLSTHSSQASPRQDVEVDCLAELCTAFRWQLSDDDASASDSLFNLSFRALGCIWQEQRSSAGGTAATQAAMQQVYHHLVHSVCEASRQQGGLTGQAGLQASCMAALHGLTCFTPWMLPDQRLALLHAYQQLSPLLGQAAGHTASSSTPIRSRHAAPLASLLQASSLSIWASLDDMSDAQICDTMHQFGRLGWRPGLLIQAMVQAVRTSLDDLPRGSHLPVSAASNTGSAGCLTVQHVVRFTMGLAQLKSSTPASRALMQHCVSEVLRTHTASLHDALLTSAEDSPLASSWDSSSRGAQERQAARSSQQQQEDEQAAQPVELGALCSLLSSYALLGASGQKSLEVVRDLMLAIMDHPDTCNLKQLGMIWWSAGHLSLSGSRLTAWLVSNTTQQLQASQVARKAADSSSVQAGQQQDPYDSYTTGKVLSDVCYGMQQLEYKPSRQLHDLLVESALRHATTMQLSHLVVVVYMVGPAGRPFLPAAMPSLHQTYKSRAAKPGSPGDSPSTLELPWARLLNVASQRLQAELPAFTLPQSIHLAWALAKCGHPVPHSTLQLIASQLLDSPPCKLFQTKADLKQHVAAHPGRGLEHVDDVLISQFLWACSVCRLYPAALLDTYTSTLPHRLIRHYLDRDAVQSAEMISAALFGLGSCQYRPSQALQQVLTTGVSRYHQFLTSHQVSSCLYGLAQLGMNPGVAWRQGLVPQLMKVAKQMSMQELTHTVWSLAQWPTRQMVGPGLYQELQAALRPVLLVHVLGAQVQAAAAYDAAGEPTLAIPDQQLAPQSAPTQLTVQGPGAAAAVAGLTVPDAPGIEFGRLPASPALSSADVDTPRTAMMVGRPPLSSSALVDLAVGVASLDVCTPEVAEAIAGWALSEQAGGLARFNNRQLCYLLWAMARCKHDRLSLFEGAGEVLVGRIMSAQPGAGPGPAGNSSGKPLTTSDVQKLIWAWAKFNRHPGEELLEAIRLAWLRATEGSGLAAGAASQTNGASNGNGSSSKGSSRPGIAGRKGSVPIEEITGIMYSLSILREHSHPLMLLLAQQLIKAHQALIQDWPAAASADQAPEGDKAGAAGLVHPRLMTQAPQLAACMLAAQAEQQQSPLVSVLTPAQRHKVIGVWRQKVAHQAAKQANYKRDLINMLFKMGLTCHVELAPDGLCAPDVTVSLPFAPNLRFTLELVGSHNTASNSGRLLGDAALKYRLLQARGYLVVPVSCKEWDKLDPYDTFSKTLYIQTKLDKRLAALTSSPTGPAGLQGATNAFPGPEPGVGQAAAAAAGEPVAAVEPPVVDVTVRAVPGRIEMAPPRAPEGSLLTSFNVNGSMDGGNN